MMDFLGDLRLGFRLLFRAPGFAATASLTLALGIGATTALFTVVNAVLLEPLPFPDSNKLIQVWRSELPALTYGSASYGRYLDWRANQRVFTDLGAWSPRDVTLSGPQGPERLPGATASASFFRVMGAAPVIGRFFNDEEDRQGARFLRYIIGLSHPDQRRAWHRQTDRCRLPGQHPASHYGSVQSQEHDRAVLRTVSGRPDPRGQGDAGDG